MWYLPILLSLFMLAIFTVTIRKLYNKYFGPDDFWNTKMYNMADTFHKFNMVLSENHLTICCNLVLQTIVFIGISLITYFTKSQIIAALYIIFPCLKWWVYSKRKAAVQLYERSSSTATKDHPVYMVLNVYQMIPIYQTILFALNELAFVLGLLAK